MDVIFNKKMERNESAKGQGPIAAKKQSSSTYSSNRGGGG